MTSILPAFTLKKAVLRSPFSVLRSPFSVLRSPFSVLRIDRYSLIQILTIYISQILGRRKQMRNEQMNNEKLAMSNGRSSRLRTEGRG